MLSQAAAAAVLAKTNSPLHTARNSSNQSSQEQSDVHGHPYSSLTHHHHQTSTTNSMPNKPPISSQDSSSMSTVRQQLNLQFASGQVNSPQTSTTGSLHRNNQQQQQQQHQPESPIPSARNGGHSSVDSSPVKQAMADMLLQQQHSLLSSSSSGSLNSPFESEDVAAALHYADLSRANANVRTQQQQQQQQMNSLESNLSDASLQSQQLHSLPLSSSSGSGGIPNHPVSVTDWSAPLTWSVLDVTEFLRQSHLSAYAKRFQEENITGARFIQLDSPQLKVCIFILSFCSFSFCLRFSFFLDSRFCAGIRRHKQCRSVADEEEDQRVPSAGEGPQRAKSKRKQALSQQLLLQVVPVSSSLWQLPINSANCQSRQYHR